MDLSWCNLSEVESRTGTVLHDIYIFKLKRAIEFFFTLKDRLSIDKIIVYGSLARGRLGVCSDIDILLVVNSTADKINDLRHELSRCMPDYFDCEEPYIDVRITRDESFESPSDLEYKAYIDNIKREGKCLWKR